jgi:acyl transferase domain-containing protein
VFSAADESGLARLSALYHQYLDELLQKHGTEDLMTLLNSLAYTLCQRRSRLQWRSFISANSISELRETAMAGAIRAVDHPRLGFIFTGQGAQYAGMATKLLRNPIFGASLDQSQHFLTDLGCSWSINGTHDCSDKLGHVTEQSQIYFSRTKKHH